MPFTPYEAAVDTIDRAQALLDATDGFGLPDGVVEDLRRLAVVMAIAALDTYMHRLVVTRVYEHEELPGGLAALTVGFGDLVAQAEASVKARQEGRDVRPKVQAKRVLRDRLLRETFQRPDDVSRALGMAGKSQSWPDIAAEMPGSWTPKALKKRLSAIVGRRNAIVHEGDYERQQRPRTAKPIPIEETEAKEAVEFLANLVRAIRSVISA